MEEKYKFITENKPTLATVKRWTGSAWYIQEQKETFEKAEKNKWKEQRI